MPKYQTEKDGEHMNNLRAHDDVIFSMCMEGRTNKEIAAELGCSAESVKTYCSKKKYHAAYKGKRDSEILKMLRSSVPTKEIEECYSYHAIVYVAKKYGINLADRCISLERVRQGIESRKTYKEIADEIKCPVEKLKGFCKRHGLRTSTKKIHKALRQAIVKDYQTSNNVAEVADTYSVSIATVYKIVRCLPKKITACANCGRETKRVKFCSDKCQHQYNARIGHAIRRQREQASAIDKDITLIKVMHNDNGLCWLCGKKVDPHDYQTRGNRFICGKSYPTVDHVVPLSKGGLHTWDNVRLAHQRCNSIKGDRNGFVVMEK